MSLAFSKNARQQCSLAYSKRLATLLIVLFLVACVKSEPEQIAVNASSSSASISVSKESVSLSDVGSQYQLSASLVDVNGDPANEQPKFEWNSDAENIVKVDQSGLLTALSLGQANVKVSGAGLSSLIYVQVLAVSSDVNLTVSNQSVYLAAIGSQFQLSSSLTDASGIAFTEQPEFTWTSEDEQIATVSQTGLITAVALGQTNITVTGGGLSEVIDVTINDNLTTLNGMVRYADKEYGSSGFTGRTDYYKSVRYAKVELMAEDGSGVEQSTYTDANGNFSFSGLLTNQQTIIVSAITDESMGLKIRVEDRSSLLYSVSKQVDLSILDNFAMDIPVTSTAAGAFNILDVFTNAGQFSLANTEEDLIKVSAYWEPNNFDGTYYCTGYDSLYCEQGAGVYVFNSVNGDTDEFDDDVLYHEFGHYFTDAFSRDDSYGGCHLLSSKDLDLRLAWSEGWGDFFPAAVKYWLSEDPSRSHLLSSKVDLPLTAYVDTYAKTAQIYIDLLNLNRNRYSTAANEMAVAKILWSLYQQHGMPAIVQVLSNYFPNLTTGPVNLESFWDGWLAEHNPTSGDLLALESTFAERQVYYQEDNFEADDSADEQRKAILGQMETHYLYRNDSVIDLDVIAFDVQSGNQYTLQTSGLTSGADTYIRVLNSAKSPLMINGVMIENDDVDESAYYGYDSVCGSSRIKNNETALASKVTFTAPSTGTYYAEVRTTTDSEPYLSAGRYGTYNFSVTNN